MTRDKKLLLLDGIQVYCKHVLDDIAESMPNQNDKQILDMLYLKNVLYDVEELELEIEQEEKEYVNKEMNNNDR